jgi:hypothetical protein
MSDIDAEGGACPECGASITGSLLYEDPVNGAYDEDDDTLDFDDSKDD